MVCRGERFFLIRSFEFNALLGIRKSGIRYVFALDLARVGLGTLSAVVQGLHYGPYGHVVSVPCLPFFFASLVSFIRLFAGRLWRSTVIIAQRLGVSAHELVRRLLKRFSKVVATAVSPLQESQGLALLLRIHCRVTAGRWRGRLCIIGYLAVALAMTERLKFFWLLYRLVGGCDELFFS